MTANGRPAVSFDKLARPMHMPHFLDVQREAFERLLQSKAVEEERRDLGLERVFREIFPITDVNENFSLEFVSYSLGDPKYEVEECIERDMTYSAPLKARLRLVIFETVGKDDEKRPGDILEKEVYLGDLPLLTEQGTFVVNGAERVIVSQLHRSPGVVFEETLHPNGTRLFSSRIIPFRGILGRVHPRHPRRDPRPHRQEEEVPRYRTAEGVRLRAGRGHPRVLLPASARADRCGG